MRGARARRFFSVRPQKRVTTQRGYQPRLPPRSAVTTPIRFPPSSPPTVLPSAGFAFEASTLNTLNVEYRKVEALIRLLRCLCVQRQMRAVEYSGSSGSAHCVQRKSWLDPLGMFRSSRPPAPTAPHADPLSEAVPSAAPHPGGTSSRTPYRSASA